MAFEIFLAALSRELSAPTPEAPTIRCWTRARLVTLAGDVCRKLVAGGKLTQAQATPTKFVALLETTGLAHGVATEPTSTHKTADFLVLELGEAAGTDATAFELLQAFRPQGVIAYFSALAYHALTTQPATHHHVVELTEGTSRQTVRSATPAADAPKARREADPLGTASFVYQGCVYYVNKREHRLVPGIHHQWDGPRTLLRVTTREQTLLDTLMRPLVCGGADVVFEAWETAAADLDQQRLAEYLERIGSTELTRRVGAMFEYLALTPFPSLAARFEAVTQSAAQLEPISMLPGIPYVNLSERWGVLGP